MLLPSISVSHACLIATVSPFHPRPLAASRFGQDHRSSRADGQRACQYRGRLPGLSPCQASSGRLPFLRSAMLAGAWHGTASCSALRKPAVMSSRTVASHWFTSPGRAAAWSYALSAMTRTRVPSMSSGPGWITWNSLLPQRSDLDTWASRLEELGISHSGVKEPSYTANAALSDFRW